MINKRKINRLATYRRPVFVCGEYFHETLMVETAFRENTLRDSRNRGFLYRFL